MAAAPRLDVPIWSQAPDRESVPGEAGTLSAVLDTPDLVARWRSSGGDLPL